MANYIDDAEAPTRRAALVCVLGPVLLSACGGGSSDTPPGTPPGTPPTTVQQPDPPPPVVQPPGAPLAITQAPADASVIAGGTVTFSVQVNDSSGAAYQWLRNGAEVAGATASSLTYAPVSLLESGVAFSVTVTNAAGNVTSPTATLTVTSPALTVIAGGPVTHVGPPAPPLDGVGTSATFGRLAPFVVDDDGNLYVTSFGATGQTTAIRKVTADGAVTPFAGVWGESGWVDGPGSSARFVHIAALSFDRARKLLHVADYSSALQVFRLREVSLSGEVTTRQALATTPQFQSYLEGVAWLPDGTAYIAGGSLRMLDGLTVQLVPTAVFKLAPGGTPVLLAGDPQAQGDSDGVGTNARFAYVRRMTADAAGNVYVIDRSRLRQITRDGAVKTIAGAAESSSTYVDGQGAAAMFRAPVGLVVEESGNIIVLDNDVIRRVTPQGRVITLATPPHNNYDLAIGGGGIVYVRAYGDASGSGGWVGRFDRFPG